MRTKPDDGPWVALGSPPAVHLRPRLIRDGLIVTLIGEADLLVERELRLVLAGCLDECARFLILDVAGLFVDVRGFSALYAAWRAGRERGVLVALAGPSRLLSRMSALLADGRVPAHSTIGEALTALRKRNLGR